MKIIKITSILILVVILNNCAGPSDKVSNSNFILIRNVTIIDGKGNPAEPGMDILIENNRIKKIGKNINQTSKTEEINGEGLSALPGLIDSHVQVRVE